ncbi:MAG: hypothetical protein ABSG13_30915 [Bryobacteraceae bacterium]|jgi:hypothetical protein
MVGNTGWLDEIKDEADKLFKMKEGAQADLKALHDYLNEQPTSTPWFFNTITVLLRALRREYHYLNIGYTKDGRLLAWACRNLLEIHLFTEYSLRSEAHARAFTDDQIVDALDIFSAFKTWIMSGDPNGTTPILDTTLVEMKQAKAQLGVTRTRYLRTEDIASELKRHDEYKHFNKVTSKLIHPTAYSLLSVQIDSEQLMLKPYLYRTGTWYFTSAFKLIKNHVEKFGTAPPPSS